MAERRARKVEARAAKIDAAKLKKETAARDARMAELDLQDSSKTFTVKVSRKRDAGAYRWVDDACSTAYASRCRLSLGRR